MLAACSHPAAESGPQRIAVLRFDNLTGDAAFDWLQNAAPLVLAAELEGSAHLLPFPAATVREASLARAPRLLHGYFDRRAGRLHFEVELEDTTRNRMTSTVSGAGETLAALSGIAKSLDPTARAFSTANDQALEAWSRGEDERATTLDPGFGAAWLDWVRKLATSGDSGGALATATRALAESGLRSPLDRARLEVLSATLRHDDAARVSGYEALAKLTPSDPAALQALGSLDLSLRRFAEAGRAFDQASLVDPSNSGYKNMAGYAQALAGNLDAARKDLEEYGRAADQAVNSLDSLGEANFINGKFADAQKSFLEAYAKSPTFLDGLPLWKAAHAVWLNGDLKGADELMERYLLTRAKAKDPLLVWRRASWLYETGRKDQAIAELRKSPPETAELANRQLAVWADPAPRNDLAQLKVLYLASDPVHDGLPRTFYAAALLEAGQKQEARQLIERWPLPESGDNPALSLLYPEFLSLRKQLL
jgi:tetratricopeptide (TPR) repeat protein